MTAEEQLKKIKREIKEQTKAGTRTHVGNVEEIKDRIILLNLKEAMRDQRHACADAYVKSCADARTAGVDGDAYGAIFNAEPK